MQPSASQRVIIGQSHPDAHVSLVVRRSGRLPQEPVRGTPERGTRPETPHQTALPDRPSEVASERCIGADRVRSDRATAATGSPHLPFEPFEAGVKGGQCASTTGRFWTKRLSCCLTSSGATSLKLLGGFELRVGARPVTAVARPPAAARVPRAPRPPRHPVVRRGHPVAGSRRGAGGGEPPLDAVAHPPDRSASGVVVRPVPAAGAIRPPRRPRVDRRCAAHPGRVGERRRPRRADGARRWAGTCCPTGTTTGRCWSGSDSARSGFTRWNVGATC